VVRRVLVHFVLPNPSDATIKRLATGFRKSGWSIKQLMRDVFTSDEFTSGAGYRSLVKQPAEFMVHALRALGSFNLNVAVQYGNGMGQVLFDPPDVGGWPLNEAWISSNTVIMRVNFITALLKSISSPPAATQAHVEQLDGVLSPATAKLLNATADARQRWTIVLTSPEFQLK
jgi:uncharacterized protein (DUF1800 family)